MIWESDRQAVLRGQAARHRDGRVPGQVGRDRAQVRRGHRHRVVGPLTEREGGGRRGRRDQHVDLAERRVEVTGDERADLLRLAVVGVVEPAGQGVGAEHDAPLHLGAEPGFAGQRHDLLGAVGAVVSDAQAVAHGVEPGQVRGAFARRDQVVRGQRVAEVRAGHLGDLGAQRLQQLHRLAEPGQHTRLVTLTGQFGNHADPQARHVGLAGGRHDRGGRLVDRGGVHRVVPGNGAWSSAASSTVRASGPGVSSEDANAISPYRELPP